MKVSERAALTKKWIDRTGQVTNGGVKVVRFLGFGIKADGAESTFGVWLCVCPKCGNEFKKWATDLENAKRCNTCHKRKRSPEERKLARVYERNKQHIDPNWSKDEFINHFYANYRAGTVCRINPKEKLSPTNWRIEPAANTETLSFSFRRHPVLRVLSKDTRVISFTSPTGETKMMTITDAASMLGCSEQDAVGLINNGSIRQAIESRLLDT